MAQTEKQQAPTALEALAANAAEHKHDGLEYAGEVSPAEAWGYLRDHEDAVLIDVRTLPEWQFVGAPDLSGAKASMIKLSWKLYPTFETNANFAAQLAEAKIPANVPLFFICRSGGRSLDAAVAMTAEGMRYCFNVSEGFEGEANASGHRGVSGGWKAAQLPWVQG